MKKLNLVIFVFVTSISFSQQLQQSSLYMYNSLYYNPGYAGSRNTLSTTLIQRNQWVGFKGAPSSQFVSVHTPLKNRRLGIGLHVNNDIIGSRKKFSVYGDLAGSIVLNKKEDRLSIGISAGLDNYQMNFASLYATDQNDQIASTNYSIIKPNVGFGVYYYGTKHYLGFSIPTLVENTTLETSINKRHLVLTGGYVFKLNSVIDFKPSTIFKYVPGAPVSCDLNASFLAYKKFWVGGLYRLKEGVGLNLSLVINNLVTVGYAYDYPLNKLRTNQYGSHEFMILLDFSKFRNPSQIYSPRYF